MADLILAGHLPDIEGHEQNIRRHPDRRAWRKACPDCAHRTSDPQDLGDRYQSNLMKFDGESVFYCLHRRTEDGFDRICACYAATNRLVQIPTIVTRSALPKR